jgi:hypothetical protein
MTVNNGIAKENCHLAGVYEMQGKPQADTAQGGGAEARSQTRCMVWQDRNSKGFCVSSGWMGLHTNSSSGRRRCSL